LEYLRHEFWTVIVTRTSCAHFLDLLPWITWVTLMNIADRFKIYLMLTLFVLSGSVWARGRAAAVAKSTLTVSVYNDAALPFATLHEAEIVSSRIFEESGIHVVWLNCSPGDRMSAASCQIAVSRSYWHLRVARHSLSLQPSVLGISYLSREGGSQADVFYESIGNLRGNATTHPAIILGHVMSHEIGHLLLGTNSHSPSGIMRAHWDQEQLGLAIAGVLYFNKSQSRLMIGRLPNVELAAECSPGSMEYSPVN
jgi:hypothetical protein